jgi:hypothetical protein
MTGFSLGFIPGIRSRLRSGAIPDLRPWLLRRPRPQRTVLEALAEVGPAGMTENSLEVTTELTQVRLNAALQPLMQAGLVCQREKPVIAEEVDAGGLTDPHDTFYLLSDYAGQRP